MKTKTNEYGLPFVLKLAEDNHIISASIYHVEIPEGAITSETLPDEEKSLFDYRFENNEFIYDPLPKEPSIEGPTFIDKLEAQVAYTAMMTGTLLEE